MKGKRGGGGYKKKKFEVNSLGVSCPDESKSNAVTLMPPCMLMLHMTTMTQKIETVNLTELNLFYSILSGPTKFLKLFLFHLRV